MALGVLYASDWFSSRSTDAVMERGVQPRRQAHRHRVWGQHGAAVGRRERQADRRAAHGPYGWCVERGVQPRRQAHRHRVLGQNGAAVGRRERQADRRAAHGPYGCVVSAAFSPDGKRIVTASWDKTARLWDAESGKQIGEPLTGHTDAVMSAAFSPDGKRIVTASWDKTARLWDAESGKQIGEPLTGHTDRCEERGVQPRRQAHRHRVFGQNGVAVENFFRRDRANCGSCQGCFATLSYRRATSSILPASRATHLVHRAGEMALRHGCLETMAQQARSPESARRCPLRRAQWATPWRTRLRGK